jgi:predicted  nucleic acid-binding Zn-ribbon protein
MKEPPYSCPNLDAAIGEIERARKIHADLRAWGQHWRDAYDEALEEQRRLESELDDYRQRLEEAESALESALRERDA